MDRYRIRFRCYKRPAGYGIHGFEKNQQYEGRSFNGFMEIAPTWGRGERTTMVDKTIFDRYFELID